MVPYYVRRIFTLENSLNKQHLNSVLQYDMSKMEGNSISPFFVLQFLLIFTWQKTFSMIS